MEMIEENAGICFIQIFATLTASGMGGKKEQAHQNCNAKTLICKIPLLIVNRF